MKTKKFRKPTITTVVIIAICIIAELICAVEFIYSARQSDIKLDYVVTSSIVFLYLIFNFVFLKFIYEILVKPDSKKSNMKT